MTTVTILVRIALLLHLFRCISLFLLLDRFKYAGQNIFNIKITNAYADPIVVAKNATNVWFDEYKSANMDIINSLQTPPPDSTG